MKASVPLLSFLLILGSCGTQYRVSSDYKGQEKSDGYITTETSSIQHVDAKDRDPAMYRSFEDYLQANVGGVEINSSGGIVIRGIGTFNGSSDPLILMDGMEIQDTGSINPNDIHSVDVIKDGSTATYGIRGANGVILITSKAAYLAKQAEREARKREQEAAKAARKAARQSRNK